MYINDLQFFFTYDIMININKCGDFMPNVDLDNEFLELFYGITNSSIPKEVNTVSLKRQLIEIVDVMRDLSTNSKKSYTSKALGNLEESYEENKGPAILVVDDLGVITYQLKVLLSKFDYDIDCSQEIYDAVGKYKKRHYRYVIMDLFIPTEREGFILLTELKKMAQMSSSKTTIGVITASPRKEIEQQCKARGADFFLEKSNDWQNTLFSLMDGFIKEESGDSEEDY